MTHQCPSFLTCDNPNEHIQILATEGRILGETEWQCPLCDHRQPWRGSAYHLIEVHGCTPSEVAKYT